MVEDSIGCKQFGMVGDFGNAEPRYLLLNQVGGDGTVNGGAEILPGESYGRIKMNGIIDLREGPK